MSLPKSEISEILSAMGDILTRLIDRVEKNIEFQPFERRELLNTLYKQICGVQIDEILSRADNKHKLQIKRGDTATNDTYTGLAGEITMDTDTGIIRVHDGETVGGVAMARAMDINGDWVVESQLPTAENNYTWYRKYKSGWVEMGGIGNFKTTINLPISMRDSKYTLIATASTYIGGSGTWAEQVTNNSFIVYAQNYGGEYMPISSTFNWCIYGYVA